MSIRTLVLVLGDQLDLHASAFDGFDTSKDAVWMAEVAEESTHVWSSKQRIVIFLAAMRHFAQDLRENSRQVYYRYLDDPLNQGTFATELKADLLSLRPERVKVTAPGDWRVLQSLRAVVQESGLVLEVSEDRHFLNTVREFAAHAKARKSLRLEYFYRELRQRHGILMQKEPNQSKPIEGRWNFDEDNRQTFGVKGPGMLPERAIFLPDAITSEVIALVEKRFSKHPGSLASFAWPVSRVQALEALRRFIDERLYLFGPYEDAMWPGEPWLYHSHLSAALNLKLLGAREVIQAAEEAYHAGRISLQSAEGFIRQILGWREYVRGIYWTQMPQYQDKNALGATLDLPSFYWTGETEMACLHEVITQTLEFGYAHHIQRLMVAGLFALLFGVDPRQTHEWYLAVYVDAVEWVELPNTLGMSQYADDGLMASKPYIASGKYIQRMGGPCASCCYDPAQRTGESACPYTTLYWDFLIRHEILLSSNMRMKMQLKNLTRLDEAERRAIVDHAAMIRKRISGINV